jgi:ppGpp synthetase/RelA/SpoT-type nucleotidyltranferase
MGGACAYLKHIWVHPQSDLRTATDRDSAMNLDEYAKERRAHYAEFAETVRRILEKAIATDGGAVRLQSVQCRAKSVKSLKHRLEEKGLLGSQTIETDRRDLAGVRLIFYTNTDVDRFRRSDVIQQNFIIEPFASITPLPRMTGYDTAPYITR